MKHMRVFVAFVLAVTAACLMVTANSAQPVQAQAVAQSYHADTALQAGMIVRLTDDKTSVAPVNQDTSDDMHGIVIRPNDAPLSLAEDEASQLVYVATSGTYQVLVSDQNGAIKEGDYVIISAIEGVGMKVDSAAQYVVGKALNGFDGKTGVLSQTNLKDVAGNEKTVRIGYVNADINVSRNPLHRGAAANVPGFLQQAADAIAGKQVSTIRIYASVAAALVTAIVASSVLYAGVRTSMIALGRNPLARKSIFRSMLRVILLGVIILIVGLFTVYLLLKL